MNFILVLKLLLVILKSFIPPKEDTLWVKKCMEYEVEGCRPKRTKREVVQKDCQARNLNRENAMDRGRWKKLMKTG